MNQEAAIRQYMHCMEEVRMRLKLIKSIGAHKVATGNDMFDIELVFVQFRKALEVVAFGSLIANKDKYAANHARFAEHWKARLMLQELEKINPDFYPMPIGKPILQKNGTKHCPLVTDGFLTRDDFELLYGKASGFLHCRNPFTAKGPVEQIKYTPKQWVERIEVLLALHVMHLDDGSKWVIEVPEEAPVHLVTAAPYQAASVGT